MKWKLGLYSGYMEDLGFRGLGLFRGLGVSGFGGLGVQGLRFRGWGVGVLGLRGVKTGRFPSHA